MAVGDPGKRCRYVARKVCLDMDDADARRARMDVRELRSDSGDRCCRALGEFDVRHHS